MRDAAVVLTALWVALTTAALPALAQQAGAGQVVSGQVGPDQGRPGEGGPGAGGTTGSGGDVEPGDVVGTAVLPGLGIRLVDTPRALADDPRAQVYVVDHVRPGARLQRHLDVSNGADEPLVVDLYAAAADAEDGWLVRDGRAANDLTTWTSFTPARVELAPGERRRVRVEIVVPPDAGGGERYAALLVEPVVAAGSGVQVRSRIGIRVYLSVGGPVAPVQDFAIDSITAVREDDGTASVVVAASNTGERALDLTGTLSLLDGPGSLTAGPFAVAAPRTVGPGSSTTLVVPMDQRLPDGPWLARASLRSGLVEREAEATISFPSRLGAVAVASPARPVARGPALGAASVLLLAAVAALAWWFLAGQHRLGARRPGASGEPAPATLAAVDAP